MFVILQSSKIHSFGEIQNPEAVKSAFIIEFSILQFEITESKHIAEIIEALPFEETLKSENVIFLIVAP